MQGRRRLKKKDNEHTSHASSAIHAPQQWLQRQSFSRSTPNLITQRSNRSFGISSIRDLARNSRRPLATLSTDISQAPTHTLRPSNSLYGTLRDQCTPPPPPVQELAAPSGPVSVRSTGSSVNSLTPDQSGISNISSHPTTVSPAKHRTVLEDSPSFLLESMGNKASIIARKPLSIRAKKSQRTLDDQWEKENSSGPSLDPPLENKPPAATYSPRGSTVQVKVPRRRSSLTVLHLDNSHFETVDPKQRTLSHRGSTLTEPQDRRSSTLADTIRPVTSHASTLKPLEVVTNRERTLSPPLLSPTSRISSVSSQTPSANELSTTARSSVIGLRIHLPKTFPEGPIPITAPPLTITHYKCYQNHRSIIPSPNTYCPVPCMTCGDSSVAQCWKCTFCMLRVCPRCMAEFAHRKKSLESLLGWLRAVDRDEEGMKEVVADADAEASEEKEVVDRKERVEKEMEELALKKVETARKRETR